MNKLYVASTRLRLAEGFATRYPCQELVWVHDTSALKGVNGATVWIIPPISSDLHSDLRVWALRHDGDTKFANDGDLVFTGRK